jgi:hypothetical protein
VGWVSYSAGSTVVGTPMSVSALKAWNHSEMKSPLKANVRA